MNSTSARYPVGDLRASDADRDAALAALSEHFQAGRLTSSEFDERSGRALTARTESELAALTVDLPDLPGQGGAGPVPAAARPASSGGALRCALALAAVGCIVSALVFPAQLRGAIFPWWLIPLCFLLCRGLIWGSRRGTGPDSRR